MVAPLLLLALLLLGELLQLKINQPPRRRKRRNQMKIWASDSLIKIAVDNVYAIIDTGVRLLML